MTTRRGALALLALIAAGFVWLFFAMDYGEGVAVGSYRYTSKDVQAHLELRADHTFHEEVRRQSHTESADGGWRHLGEGGIVFSEQFLLIPGQERSPDGAAYAEIHKAMGLFVSLQCAQHNVLWYGKSDGSGDSLAGTYKGDEDGYVKRLTVNPDHTFTQSVSRNGTRRNALGTWVIDRQGKITFSKEFLNASGVPLEEDEFAFDEDPRDGHLQIEVATGQKHGVPRFTK